MKRYLVKAGTNVVLADGNSGDIKAIDGGGESGLQILQKLNRKDVINKTSPKYGLWYLL
jgi:hypothetical protein